MRFPSFAIQKSVFIKEIHLYSYNGPFAAQNKVVPPLGIVVKVLGESAGRDIVGIGEARLSKKNRDIGWDSLVTTADHLAGTTLRWRGSNPDKVLSALASDSSVETSQEQALEALRRACRDLMNNADHSVSGTYISLRERRPEEDWPEVIVTTEQGYDIDHSILFRIINKCEFFPPVSTIYQATSYDYSEHFMPGDPYGLPAQFHFEVTALRAGLSTTRYSRRDFIASRDSRSAPIGFVTLNSNGVSTAVIQSTQNKVVGKKLLEKAGLPFPPGIHFPAEETPQAIDHARDMQFPLVVKPANGRKGYGITTDIASADQLPEAIDKAIAAGFSPRDVIVEQQVTGSDYRILATDEKALSVTKRNRAHIVGDGIHSVGELITVNSAARKRNPHLSRRTFLSDMVADMLKEQGVGFDSVPEDGAKIYLARAQNYSQGASSESVMSDTHPTILDAAVRAVRAFGMPYGGVDIFLQDHRLALAEQDPYIVEVNAQPGLGSHFHPVIGERINPYEELFNLTARRSSVPLDPYAKELSICIAVEGKIKPKCYQRWIARVAHELKIGGSVRIKDRNRVEILAHGGYAAIAHLLRRAHQGPEVSRVASTHTQPVDMPMPSEFQVEST